MHFNGPDRKDSRKVVVTKISFYGKTKWKMKVGAIKIQPDCADKKEIRKRGYHYNIVIVLLKWNKKCKLHLLKCSSMVHTKRNQEKVVVTEICFYGSAKIEWKIKVCVMENSGSIAKMIKMRVTTLC